jgi:cell division initiation protein
MVNITPIEIRNKKFEKVFRGYNVDDVNAFLHSIAHSWTKTNEEISALKQEIEQSKNEIARLIDIENSLLNIINNAKDTASNIVENAKKEANIIIGKINFDASSIIENANKESSKIIEDAKKEALAIRENVSIYKDCKKKIIDDLEKLSENVKEQIVFLKKEDVS